MFSFVDAEGRPSCSNPTTFREGSVSLCCEGLSPMRHIGNQPSVGKWMEAMQAVSTSQTLGFATRMNLSKSSGLRNFSVARLLKMDGFSSAILASNPYKATLHARKRWALLSQCLSIPAF